MRQILKQACSEALQKIVRSCPVYFALKNPKLLSDLKSDLDSKTYDVVPMSTAGLPISKMHTKNNFPTNQKGYDNYETTIGKLLTRRIQIFQISFLWSLFDLLVFKTSEKRTEQKCTRQIWIASSNTRLPRS